MMARNEMRILWRAASRLYEASIARSQQYVATLQEAEEAARCLEQVIMRALDGYDVTATLLEKSEALMATLDTLQPQLRKSMPPPPQQRADLYFTLERMKYFTPSAVTADCVRVPLSAPQIWVGATGHRLGPFTLEIATRTWDIRVFPQETAPRVAGGYWHPHVALDGVVAWDEETAHRLDECIRRCVLDGLISCIKERIAWVDHARAYVPLTEWPLVAAPLGVPANVG